MLLNDLIYNFEETKKRQPLHDNELLDYIQWCYIYNKLSIVEYRNLFRELDLRGATKPLFIDECSEVSQNIS